ncbi:hypothetical protein C8Q74DRAFT_529845 [Fomes fomentarius]|nr:hypothetical protein C8Q74DRAFT_529845 [Fomes fomentarius]
MLRYAWRHINGTSLVAAPQVWYKLSPISAAARGANQAKVGERCHGASRAAVNSACRCLTICHVITRDRQCAQAVSGDSALLEIRYPAQSQVLVRLFTKRSKVHGAMGPARASQSVERAIAARLTGRIGPAHEACPRTTKLDQTFGILPMRSRSCLDEWRWQRREKMGQYGGTQTVMVVIHGPAGRVVMQNTICCIHRRVYTKHC